MRIISVVGARPQFIKLAPVAEALTARGWQHIIVHTGQHYDSGMSDVFFADLRIPSPDVSLGIGSGGHGGQTGAMLAALDDVLPARRPDWVMVYGDTNSTLAAAVSAVKLHLPVAHLEAGLRSFNRLMPEEHNRVLTDHAADLLLAPTEVAARHLAREGLAERTRVVGDVMADICLRVRDAVLDGSVRAAISVIPAAAGDEYLVATLHRPENTDDPLRLRAVVQAMAKLPLPVVLMAHPRLRRRAAEHGVDLSSGSLIVVDPAPYSSMVASVLGSRGVVTDSGGLQKETYLLGKPCTTLRTETEWVETLVNGWNRLVPDPADLAAAVLRKPPDRDRGDPYGAGRAAESVADALEAHGRTSQASQT